MRAIVDDTIEHGIIPVLSTFSYDPGMGLWNQSVNFNHRLIEIAADYQSPADQPVAGGAGAAQLRPGKRSNSHETLGV